MPSVAALRHALMELIPEPRGLSFKDTQQRVTLVPGHRTGKVMSLGLKQAARAFQANGTAEDKCRVNDDHRPTYLPDLVHGLPGGEDWGWKSVTIAHKATGCVQTPRWHSR